MVVRLTSQGREKLVASKIPPLWASSSSKKRWNELRRSRRKSSNTSLAQKASSHSWKSASGSSSARKNGGSPPRSSRCSRSGRSKSTRSAAESGVSQISSFRPARASRKRAEAPSVEEPVARTRVEGKWSAAILSSSEGLPRRWISSRTTRLPSSRRRKASGSSISRRTRGSSQSKYSTWGRLWQRLVLPTRRTPVSQRTVLRSQALRRRCCQKVRAYMPPVWRIVRPNAILLAFGPDSSSGWGSGGEGSIRPSARPALRLSLPTFRFQEHRLSIEPCRARRESVGSPKTQRGDRHEEEES